MHNYIIDPTSFLNIDGVFYKKFYKTYCPSDESRTKSDHLFKTMWELFLWAAVVGYTEKARKPIKKRYGSPPFRWQVIGERHKRMLLRFAIASEGSFDILNDPDEVRKNIEEHANGGLYKISEEIEKDRTLFTTPESLVSLIQKRLKK